MVEALEAVAWEGLGESARDGLSSLATAALPFVVALATDPGTGARTTRSRPCSPTPIPPYDKRRCALRRAPARCGGPTPAFRSPGKRSPG